MSEVYGPPESGEADYRPNMEAILAQAGRLQTITTAAKTLAALSGRAVAPVPMVIDARAADSPSLQLLYGRGGPGSKLGSEDYAILQSFYNLELDHTYGYDQAQPGQLYWGIYAIEIREGPAELRPAVFDKAGKSLTNQSILAFMSWCGAPNEFPSKDIITPKYPARPCDIYGYGVLGWTETKGAVGFGTSGGSHIGPEGGPFTVWLAADNDASGPRVGSDALHRVGWFDNHIHPNPQFRVMEKAAIPAPGGEYSLTIEIDGQVVGRLAFSPDPVTGQMILAIWKDGQRVGAIEVPSE